MCYWVTLILLLKLGHSMEQLCVNSNNLAVPDSSATNYMSYETSTPQLFDDMAHILIRLGDNLRGQNVCQNTGTHKGL